MQTVKNIIQSVEKNILYTPERKVAATIVASASIVTAAITATTYFAGMSVSATSPAAAIGIGIAAITNPIVSVPLFGTVIACCTLTIGAFIVNNFLSEPTLHEIKAQDDLKKRRKRCEDLKKQIQDEIDKCPPPDGNRFIQQKLDDFNIQRVYINGHLKHLNKRTVDTFLRSGEQARIDGQLKKIEDAITEITQRQEP